MSGLLRRPAVVLAIVVVVLVAAADAFLLLRVRAGDRDDAARTAAVAAARIRVATMFSYSSQTLAADLDRASAQTTGDFRDDYRSVLDRVVRPAATGRAITTKATVTAAGAISARSDRVVVLVFLTQTTANGTQVPTVTGSRLRVTLRHTAHGWLVSDLTTV